MIEPISVILLLLSLGGYLAVAIFYSYHLPSLFRNMESQFPEVWVRLGRPKWYWHHHPAALHKFINQLEEMSDDVVSKVALGRAKRMRNALYWSYAFFVFLVFAVLGIFLSA